MMNELDGVRGKKLGPLIVPFDLAEEDPDIVHCVLVVYRESRFFSRVAWC